MAKEKKPKAPKKPKSTKYMMELAVTFGKVSIGDKIASIRVVCSRPTLSLTAADKNLCDRRLIGSIVKLAGSGEPDQKPIPGFEGNDWQVDGAFDVNGFSVSKKYIKFGMSFMIESIKVSDLAHFAQQKGMVRVEQIEAIPEGEQGNDDPAE